MLKWLTVFQPAEPPLLCLNTRCAKQRQKPNKACHGPGVNSIVDRKGIVRMEHSGPGIWKIQNQFAVNVIV